MVNSHTKLGHWASRHRFFSQTGHPWAGSGQARWENCPKYYPSCLDGPRCEKWAPWHRSSMDQGRLMQLGWCRLPMFVVYDGNKDTVPYNTIGYNITYSPHPPCTCDPRSSIVCCPDHIRKLHIPFSCDKPNDKASASQHFCGYGNALSHGRSPVAGFSVMRRCAVAGMHEWREVHIDRWRSPSGWQYGRGYVSSGKDLR